ncbi:MAG: glutaminase [Muribaculaceae bacterium]|nr:glutaminase [Muribaculaceae bacterium]
MTRKISLGDVQKAVVDAYENFKSIKEGEKDPRIEVEKDNLFGISVVLTDGTVINKGDTDALTVMGDVAQVSSAVVLMTQNKVKDLMKKIGMCKCGCAKTEKHAKPHIGLSRHGVRAVSIIQPQNDPEGKWDVMINNFINLVGSAPVLNDKYYKAVKQQLADENAVDQLAQAEFSLYDQANIALDLYAKLTSLQVNTQQLATLGATIAADGRNVTNGQVAFDGEIAANVVGMMATRGLHKEAKGWNVMVGLPARSGKGGLILAVLPGFGAIAAYSPELDQRGVSVKAKKAIKYIANTLQLNVYSSARVEVEK